MKHTNTGMNADDVRYYLGEPVRIVKHLGGGWVEAVFLTDKDEKPWKMWEQQLLATPWGEETEEAT